MTSKNSSNNAKHCFSIDSISHLQDLIQSQKEILPFDLLGRSLSYNPYPPRFFEMFPMLCNLDFVMINLLKNKPKSLLNRAFAL